MRIYDVLYIINPFLYVNLSLMISELFYKMRGRFAINENPTP